MTRLPRSRVAMTALLVLGAGALGLAGAPSALAAPDLTATAPSSVVAGTPFTVSGTGCVAVPENYPEPDYVPDAWALTDVAAAEDATEIASVPTAADGSWSAELAFPLGTTGLHEVYAACGNGYHGDPVEYPTLTVQVTAATNAPAGATPTAPAAATTSAPAVGEWKAGAIPNTPGIAPASSSATTAATPAPGTKVVRMYGGFQPYEQVTLTLHSTPVALGTFPADANGVVTVEFTLPAGTPIGAHTLELAGDKGSHYEDALTVVAPMTESDASLAYTGASLALPLVGGTVLVAAGATALVVGRRRRTAGASQA
jgi:hypothetical protein